MKIIISKVSFLIISKVSFLISKIRFRVICLISLSSIFLVGLSIPLLVVNNAPLHITYPFPKEEFTQAQDYAKNASYLIRSAVRKYVDEHGTHTLAQYPVIGRLDDPHLREKLGLFELQLTGMKFSLHDYYIVSSNNNGDSSIVIDATRFGDPEHTPEIFFHLDIYGNWFKIDGVYSLFNMLK